MASGSNSRRMVDVSIIGVKLWYIVIVFYFVLSKTEGNGRGSHDYDIPHLMTTLQQPTESPMEEQEVNPETKQPKTINDAQFMKAPETMTEHWKIKNGKNLTSVIVGRRETTITSITRVCFIQQRLDTLLLKKDVSEVRLPGRKILEETGGIGAILSLRRRVTSYIQPQLSYSVLNRTVVYVRATGTRNRLFWKWNETAESVKQNNTENKLTELMTKYKMVIIGLFDTYASVRASCSQGRLYAQEGNYVDWEKKKVMHCKFLGRDFFHCITCNFKEKGLAFEPVIADLVIQELDESASSIARLEATEWPNKTQGLSYWTPGLPQLAPSVNVLAWSIQPPVFSNRTKWVVSTHHQASMRDCNPELKPGRLPIYKTHPSMSESDLECKKRVAKDRSCHSPVGGLQVKLAFWPQVHYDSAGNLPKFPGNPIQLKGDGRDEMGGAAQRQISINSEQRRVRRKRQIWSLAMTVFNIANTDSLREEFNDKINKLTTQLNKTFKQDEDNLQKLAERLNDLSQANTIEAEKLNQVILEMMKNERVRDEQIQFLGTEMEQNKEMLLRELDTFFYEV